MKWISAFTCALGILKYLFLVGLSVFMVYMIGLLRRNVD